MAAEKALPAPGTPSGLSSTGEEKPKRPSREITLADLEVMPLPPKQHPLLSEMPIEHLGEMVATLNTARTQYESLSGACATLAGLVCIEAKKRAGHGGYMPWLAAHLGKSRKTAAQYVAVANAFSKCNPRVTFGQMTLALMDGAQEMSGQGLDMTHPMVSAVATWTDGRTFYELREKFAGQKGGAREAKKPKLTPEEERAAWLAQCREHFSAAFMDLDRLVTSGNWQAESVTDAELDAAAAVAEKIAGEMRAWLKLPAKKRTRKDAAEIEAGRKAE